METKIVAFNGEPLTWVDCGMKNYTIALLNELFHRDDGYFYKIFVPASLTVDLDVPADKGKIIKIKRIGYLPKKLTYINNFIWENFKLANAVKKSGASLFFSPWQARTVKDLHMPSVVVVHDTLQWNREVEDRAFGPQFFYNQYARGVRKADAIITISEVSRDDIAERLGISLSKITNAHEGIEQVFYKLAPAKEVSEVKEKYNLAAPYVLYVGSFHGRKNVIGTAKAFIKYVKDYKDEKIIFVVIAGAKKIARGRTNPNELVSLMREEGLESRLKILYSVPHSDIVQLYRGAELFLYLSLYEGFGLPPLEAMSQEVPVIVSNKSSLPEVVGDGGILVDPNNLNSIAKEINSVLHDADLRASLIKRGKARVAYFSWDKTVTIIIDKFNRLLEK